ncbi:MAG: hypothetical protein GY913_06235 [Proteobacteria bacterium]|nr:hypothetical protein [Pseudomonadota bacterium]MCP4916505.1 hypothetical protein [Pseudomonadota bacterium]
MLVFSLLSLPATDGFDQPVGHPDAEGYFDAQPFGVNHHLGQDWNGNGNEGGLLERHDGVPRSGRVHRDASSR